MVGDIVLKIGDWLISLLLIILPNDILNLENSFKNFLVSTKSNLISILNFISVYFDLSLFFILILIILATPVFFLTAKFLVNIIKMVRG